MQNFYIQVDDEFLRSFPLQIKTNIESHINKEFSKEGKERSFFFRLCPYCNRLGLLSTGGQKNHGFRSPTTCVFCGETNPYEKISASMEKANILYGLSIFCASGDGTDEEEINERVLLEQTIVILATGLEVFLRDVYSSAMNLKYVKENHTLFDKFSNESKNSFINMGKTIRLYKIGLEIDLKTILSVEEQENIILLFLKRNAIVHNNGVVDQIFFSQSGIKCQMGDLIPISNQEICNYFDSIRSVVNKIESEFDKIMSPQIHRMIEKWFS